VTPSLTIDTTGIMGMFRDLSRMSGRDLADVTRDQAGKILETAIRYTPMAKMKVARETAQRTVRRRFNTYGAGDVGTAARNNYPRISISQKRGKVWWVDKNEDGLRVFYLMNGSRKWSDERWGKYLAEENDRINDLAMALETADKRAIGAIGLARQSWVQIADSLGIPLRFTSEGRIRSAIASTGRRYINGRGTETTGQNSFIIELINDHPILVDKLGGAGILQRAVSTRRRAFDIDMKKGVFNNIELRVKRYPGIYTI
jgi:hypothetical protein